MTYTSVVQINQSQSLKDRVAACAAEQGIANPVQWAYDNMLTIASKTDFGWGAAWDSGLASNQPGADTGARTDVITDAMILTAVQTLKPTATV